MTPARVEVAKNIKIVTERDYDKNGCFVSEATVF